MKLKLVVILLTAFMAFGAHITAEETIEDDQYIYTKRSWAEISADYQRLLMRHFCQKLNIQLEKMHVPSFWNRNSEQTLLGNQKKFVGIATETHSRTHAFASENNVNLEDLIPTGFIMGLGISGSGNIGIGLGGSALLTLIVVPYELEQYNKTTGETSVSYEATWAIGGFGQQGVGAGGGGGLVVRGAIGFIWGPLPNASDLRGWAVGASANIAAVQGVGFKAALVFNQNTQQKNVVALATYDMGIALNAGVEASAFYFMDADEITNFLSLSTGTFSSITGQSKVAAKELLKSK